MRPPLSGLMGVWLCFAAMTTAQLLSCSSTITIGTPLATIACYDISVTRTTVVTTITVPGPVVVTTATTTSYSATDISCLSSATTLTASSSPILPLPIRRTEERAAVPELQAPEDVKRQISLPIIPLPALLCPPALPPLPVVRPLVPGAPCVTAVSPYTTVTSTITNTLTIPSIVISQQPTSTRTLFRTVIQPTPSIYPGIKYHQYTNTYDYFANPDGGFGGGGYATSDWRSNPNFETSGLTQSLDLATPNYPSSADLRCQLPGQPAPTNCEQWTVVYQGFLFARTSGLYRVTAVPPADNGYFGWGGEKAYNGFEDANVDFKWPPTAATPDVSNATTYNLTAGEFFPMTLIWVDGGGPALQRTTVEKPDGTVYPRDGLDLWVPPCEGGAFVP